MPAPTTDVMKYLAEAVADGTATEGGRTKLPDAPTPTAPKAKRERKPRALVPSVVALTLTLPLRLSGSLNSREHHMARHQRVKTERAMFGADLILMVGRYPPPALRQAVAVQITFTRLGGNRMDDDNLEGIFKGCRDELARWFDRDDGDQFFSWRYAQEPGKLHGARVELLTPTGA